MNKLTKVLLSGAIALSIIAIVVAINSPVRRIVAGSVNYGSEYQSTTTDATWNTNNNLVVSGTGVLGSVVITLTSNAPLVFYDATTTGPHSDHATTTIASFKTTTAGTYVFDAYFTRGLVVETASTVGKASSTITYRVR